MVRLDMRFRVFIDKFKTSNDGLHQGFVSVPILFNLYLRDIANTPSEKLAFTHSDFEFI